MPKGERIIDRLRILAQGARFDASCASDLGGGLTFKERKKDISRFIYHSWTDSGRCVPILKVLLTNYCIYDCAYCYNRRSNDIERDSFMPEELAYITSQLYKKGKIEGLFLSSGIVKSSNYTMELMYRTLQLLRNKYEFLGYIHSKILPATDEVLIEKIGRLSDRISVNVEFSSEESLKYLAPDKDRDKVIRPIVKISELINKYRSSDNSKCGSTLRFSPSGQSTQIIVGATNDTDLKILLLSEYFYKRLGMSRVYYSAYVPVNEDSRLPYIKEPPLKREHRLYQADWLIRDYGFDTYEIVNNEHPNLRLELDPKTEWAINHIEYFPVEINSADYEQLIRIPGIGKNSAKRIIDLRKYVSLDEDALKVLRIPFKKTRHFIKIKGKYQGEKLDSEYIRKAIKCRKAYEQISLKFSKKEIEENVVASNTGEL
ncbi:MAG: putative DNA modification/repair radical SAM protein [Deltaproteobacteria bacterium]|nr:putative DNA modification/repair radical SAM protein [Deltaproteobacteria bacterium]